MASNYEVSVQESDTEDEVILNVAGEKTFHTTKATLSESGYFAGHFSGRWSLPKNADNINTLFVDVDAEVFSHILEHLRTGLMPLFWSAANGFDGILYGRVLGQARFLNIPALAKWIEQRGYEAAVTTSRRVSNLEYAFVDHHGDFAGDTIANGDTTVTLKTEWIKERQYLCPRNMPYHNERDNSNSCREVGYRDRLKKGENQKYKDKHWCKVIAV